MTTLSKRMHDGMKLRNLAASTQASYAQHVSMLAKYFDRSPETIASNGDGRHRSLRTSLPLRHYTAAGWGYGR